MYVCVKGCTGDDGEKRRGNKWKGKVGERKQGTEVLIKDRGCAEERVGKTRGGGER